MTTIPNTATDLATQQRTNGLVARDEFDLPDAREMIPVFEEIMNKLATGPVSDNKWFTQKVLSFIILGVTKYHEGCANKWIVANDRYKAHKPTSDEIGLSQTSRLENANSFWQYQQQDAEAVMQACINLYNKLVKNELLYENHITGEINEFCQWGKYQPKVTQNVTDQVAESKKEAYLLENKERIARIRSNVSNKNPV